MGLRSDTRRQCLEEMGQERVPARRRPCADRNLRRTAGTGAAHTPCLVLPPALALGAQSGLNLTHQEREAEGKCLEGGGGTGLKPSHSSAVLHLTAQGFLPGLASSQVSCVSRVSESQQVAPVTRW